MSATTTHGAVDALGEQQCRWPIGDPRRGPFRFCTADKQADGPYCDEHHSKAHVQREPAPAAETQAPRGAA